jgi:hypothetical protein
MELALLAAASLAVAADDALLDPTKRVSVVVPPPIDRSQPILLRSAH